MAAFCFSQSRTKGSHTMPPVSTISIVQGRADFDAHMISADNDDMLLAVCWSAEWCSLNVEATHAFQQLAETHGHIARFISCSVDDLTELAREYAVYDLPSVHIFHKLSLVERLSGLQRVKQFAGPVLQYHCDLASSSSGGDLTATTAGTQAAASWLPACTSPSEWSIRSASSGELSPTNEACPTPDLSFERRHSGHSTCTAASERSYKPQYIRKVLVAQDASQKVLQWLPSIRHSLTLDSPTIAMHLL